LTAAADNFFTRPELRRQPDAPPPAAADLLDDPLDRQQSTAMTVSTK